MDKNPELVFDIVDDKNEVVKRLKDIIYQIKEAKLKQDLEDSFAKKHSITASNAMIFDESSSVLIEKSDYEHGFANIQLKKSFVVKMYELKASYKSGNAKQAQFEIKMVGFVGKDDQ